MMFRAVAGIALTGLFARQFGRPVRAGRPPLAAFALGASFVVGLELAQVFIRSLDELIPLLSHP